MNGKKGWGIRNRTPRRLRFLRLRRHPEMALNNLRRLCFLWRLSLQKLRHRSQQRHRHRSLPRYRCLLLPWHRRQFRHCLQFLP